MSPRLNPHVVGCLAEDFRPIRHAQRDPALISLAVADPYHPPSPHVLAAYHEAIDAGLTRYGPSEGLPELREAISDKLARHNRIRADPKSEVLVTHGAGHGFLLTLLAFLQPGDEVLTPDPSFPLNFGTTQLLGAVPVSCPIGGREGVTTLVARMEAAVTPRTRLIIVHNPNNPTGDLLPPDVLQGIARVAQEHDLAVLSDEVYERFVYDGQFQVSIATLPGMRERTVTLFSFSKDYRLSGLRVGYLVAAPEVTAAIARIQQNDGSGASPAAQWAALAALTGPQDDLEDLTVELGETRRWVVDALNGLPGVVCPLPPAGYFVFPELGQAGDTEGLCGEILTEARVGLAPGTWYGRGGAGHARLCYAAAPPSRVAEALERLGGFLQRRHGRGRVSTGRP